MAAFPELFTGTPNDRHAALAAALAQSTPMTQPPQFPRDCAPSLHTAWALIALLAAWSQSRRFSLLVLPLGAMSIITTLTLCNHYTADLVLAVPFALLCWVLADLLTGRSLDPAFRRHPHLSHFLLAVAGALGVFGWWAIRAPVSPWLAWPLAGACVALPIWANLRLNQPHKSCRQNLIPRPG